MNWMRHISDGELNAFTLIVLGLFLKQGTTKEARELISGLGTEKTRRRVIDHSSRGHYGRRAGRSDAGHPRGSRRGQSRAH